MPTFRYMAADQRGRTVKGSITADSSDAAGLELDREGLIPLQLKRVQAFTERWRGREGNVHWRIEEKVLFTRKFASLIKAGIPLLRVLDLVAGQTSSPHVADALRRIGDSISAGKSLHEAMAAYPGLFDPIYLGTVRTGEVTGHLDTVLESIASFLEREMNTRRKIKEATRYPVMVIVAILIAGIVVLKFVVPQFMSFYSGFGSELPGPTRLLLAISELVGRIWWLLLLLLAAGVVGWKWWVKTPRGRKWRDQHLIRLPLVGSLFLKVAVCQFARLFGLLYSSGIPATTALETVVKGIGNIMVANEVSAMCDRLATGGEVAERPPDSVMPDLVYQMIGIGFESGELERMLVEVARHYEDEIDYEVRRLTERLQPIILLFLAAGVLTLALAVLLPMWNLIGIFKP